MVSLPRDYATSGKTYPVLYALDGWHFPLLAFIQNNSTSLTRRMPPVIVVVIGHGHPPNLNEVREQDFLGPMSQPKGISGHAERFLEFIENELIPFIDRQYRTMASDRSLLGHSYGGGFAIYALAERPSLFQRIVCVALRSRQRATDCLMFSASVFRNCLRRLCSIYRSELMEISLTKPLGSRFSLTR